MINVVGTRSGRNYLVTAALMLALYSGVSGHAYQNPTLFTASDVPVALVNSGTAGSEIDTGDPVSLGPLHVGDVNVMLDITCSSTSALIASLRSPEGTEVTLFNELDGDGQNFTDVQLNDQADERIGVVYAPYTGTWQPQGSLSDFEHEDGRGVWTLTVYDAGGGTVGSIDSWSLEFLTPTYDEACVNNILIDGGFEYPELESRWVLGTPELGTTGEIRDDSSAAYAGDHYLYLKAIGGGEYGRGISATTTFTLAPGVEAYLGFYLSVQIDTFQSDYAYASVGIDSFPIEEIRTSTGDYRYHAYDLSAYADGQEHTLRFYVYASRFESVPTTGSIRVDNVCIQTVSDSNAVINEFVANHAGVDDTAYVELFEEEPGPYATLRVVELAGDETDNPGRVRSVLPLSTTEEASLLLAGFPEGVSQGSMTLLLTEAFSGVVDDDLDPDDDGILDETPWIRLLDSVAVYDGGPADQTYSPTVLDAIFGGGTYPGGASRIPDGQDTDTDVDWVINAFNGAGLGSILATPEPGYALNTPGMANAVVPANGEGCAVYTSTDVGQEILSGYTFTSELTLAETGIVADVNVFIDITHTFTGDIVLHLISPEGTSVELINGVGASGDNFTATVLDDSSPVSIGTLTHSSYAPFTGIYAPTGSLADFNGEAVNGTWQLQVEDISSGNSGTLNTWSLQLCMDQADGLHPADDNEDLRIVLGEAIAYLTGWQQGGNPLAYAIRAAYLWQNGEHYMYDSGQEPPLCWILAP